MKIKNIKIPAVILALATTLGIGILIGYQLAKDTAPKNCAELGTTYLEIGKEELGITDYGSEQWKKLIEDETKFTNDCYKSYQK